MTITLLQLVTFIIAVSVFVLTPGPGVFATIAKAMSEGIWAVLPLTIGLAAGDTIYMVLSTYGLSTLATNYNSLFLIIKYIGAIYLFYLAYKMWITVPASIDMVDTQHNKSNTFANITSGFLISSSNPKVILFYVSLLPSFFPVASLTTIDIIIVSAIIFIVAVVMMLGYAIMASYAQKQLESPKSRQNFNRVGAFFMGSAGVWLLSKK